MAGLLWQPAKTSQVRKHLSCSEGTAKARKQGGLGVGGGKAMLEVKRIQRFKTKL